MVSIRLATLNDLERLRDCELQVWESLREMLPDSFVTPNIQFIQRPEYVQNWRQVLQSREGIILIAEEDEEIIGMVTGRVREDGVVAPWIFGR